MSSIKYYIKGTVKGSRSADSFMDDMASYELVEYLDEIQQLFKDDNELAQYLDSDDIIYGVVTEIRVGVKVLNHNLYSWTEVTATRKLTDVEKKALLDYLSGQFSDGYGEGLEQQAFTTYTDTETSEEYDEENDEYYEDEYNITVYCFLNLWHRGDFELEFVEADETVEENIPEITKPRCKLIGEDGNIFNLIGIASRTLRRAGLADKATEMQKRVTSSGSYSEALAIIMEYVEVE